MHKYCEDCCHNDVCNKIDKFEEINKRVTDKELLDICKENKFSISVYCKNREFRQLLGYR